MLMVMSFANMQGPQIKMQELKGCLVYELPDSITLWIRVNKKKKTSIHT